LIFSQQLDYEDKLRIKMALFKHIDEQKTEYTPDELDRFESLTCRFARLCDILLQKIFRLIDTLDLEMQGSLRDRIYRAEKKGLIKNVELFIECRMLRKDIAHEYMPENVLIIFKKVLEKTPFLLDSVKITQSYCEKYIKEI